MVQGITNIVEGRFNENSEQINQGKVDFTEGTSTFELGYATSPLILALGIAKLINTVDSV